MDKHPVYGPIRQRPHWRKEPDPQEGYGPPDHEKPIVQEGGDSPEQQSLRERFRAVEGSLTGRLQAVNREAHRLKMLIEEMSDDSALDARWIAIGRTHLQEGLMALRRAITRQEEF